MSPTRKALLAVASVTVLAERGPRGLTHRAVDAAAKLSAGAVNYHAPNRAALLTLALEEVFAADMATAAAHFSLEEWSHDSVVAAVVGFVTDMCSVDNRIRVIARHHLRGEAMNHPQLRATFDLQLAAFTTLVRDGMVAAKVEATTASAELFALSVDGLLLRQVMVGAQPLSERDVRAIADMIARRQS
nr:TetR family transcriptional regulator [Rhodococcus sp. (in: high G+C Gram-positive bacteria)]